jgi:WD40 repeat protein
LRFGEPSVPRSFNQDRRIFISYAHRDGSELATRLQQDLSASGFDAWLDTHRLRAGVAWTLAIEQEIDNRDIVLALVTPASYRSEICRAEQLRALRKGKRLIPILAAKGADRPLPIEPFQYRDFTDPDSYQSRFRQLLDDIQGDITAILPLAFRETHVSYITAPPPVANYIERPAALRSLRDSMFAEDHRNPIALTALAGMGGIGKTVLAQALVEDEIVQQAFPDGIVWITAGRETPQDFILRMREIAKALGDDLSRYDNPLACQNQYKSTIANKAALIVVDDVWSKADIDPLLAKSHRSRFLFTTRDSSIASFVGAREHRADLMDMAQSRELLASWANLPVEQLPPEAHEIIRECGRLPLALSQIGAMLRNQTPTFWGDTLGLLRNVDLSAIQEQLPPGQKSFFRAVEVSFLALTPKMQERYKALAVLLEDMPGPLPILQALWKASEAEARLTSKHFVDRSLAQREPDRKSIRLHDLQLDYVRYQYQDKEALELIHTAMRLSSHVIAKDPFQFASQITGRLLPHQELATINQFALHLLQSAPRPWIQLIEPALHPPGTSLIRNLHGHLKSVHGVAVSANGRRAVSASADHTLKIWDVNSGRELCTLQGHSDSVNAVAMDADVRRALSASDDGTVKVWDLERGCELRTLWGHSEPVFGVAVTPDGRHALSASRDKTLKIWDVDMGRELRTLKGHSHFVYSVAVSANGQRAISASADNTVKVWDVENGCELRSLHGHSTAVYGVALSADGRRAISSSQDCTVKVWDVESGSKIGILKGHSTAVCGVALSADGRRAISASYDKTLKVWDVDNGCELRSLRGHADWVRGVGMSSDGRRAVSASDDLTLKVWDLESGREPAPFLGHAPARINGVAVSSDGRCALSASNDQTVKVWDLETGRELHSLKGHSSFVLGVAVSADGRRAVSASSDQTLKLWDVENGRELGVLRGHEGSVTSVAMSADGRRAVSASYDQTLKLWDVESGRELRCLRGHSYDVLGVAVSADWRRAISASGDNTLKVWDLNTGHELRTLQGHSQAVWGVAVSADGRRAISASGDNTLKVWDVDSGCELRSLRGHSAPVGSVALSADGHQAISGSADNTLKVWDVASGKTLATFTCDGVVYCCTWTGFGKMVAGDEGGHIYMLKFICTETNIEVRN